MTQSFAFATNVRAVAGTWPGLPPFWSYSSLRDAEECPRRWALSRATYPTIWDERGYPPRPILPALIGDIIHKSLDLILRRLCERNCSSTEDPTAAEVLRDLGGYSLIVEREVAKQIDALQSNPRMTTRAASLRAALQARLPEIRQRLQTMVSRATVTPTRPRGEQPQRPEAGERMALRHGSHPEVSLRAPHLRFAGRADLLTLTDNGCAVVDYKTGDSSEHHVEQVRLYQLLWWRDRERNPDGVPVTSLTLAYSTHEVPVEPLATGELDALAETLTSRVRAVELEVAKQPPPARPSPDMCWRCDVRHLCDDYWFSAAADDDGRDFVDREGLIVAANGPKSWILDSQRPVGERVLLRAPTEQPGFGVGDGVRLLDLVPPRDDDETIAALSLTPSSEVFLLSDSTT